MYFNLPLLHRTLFFLHEHTISLETKLLGDACRLYTQAALDAVSRIVLDTTHNALGECQNDPGMTSPISTYILSHTIQHLSTMSFNSRFDA